MRSLPATKPIGAIPKPVYQVSLSSHLNRRRVDPEAARDGGEGLADDARALLAEGHLGQPGLDAGREHEARDEERHEEEGGVPWQRKRRTS